jgi:hypothetical protein
MTMFLVLDTDDRRHLGEHIAQAEADGQRWRIDAIPIDGPFGREWRYEMYVDQRDFEGPRAA